MRKIFCLNRAYNEKIDKIFSLAEIVGLYALPPPDPMSPEDFQAPQAGQVIRAPQGYHAFVPAPLPPELIYTPSLVRLLSAADAALSELSGIGRVLPNPHLLLASYVRREAVLSSRIEGTRASLSDVLADEAGQPAHAPPDDVREVRNYVDALDFGIERLHSLPLSLRLVRELHERLMRGVRGDSATPGEFRRSQNWIGPDPVPIARVFAVRRELPAGCARCWAS